jgi:hypothetical protein
MDEKVRPAPAVNWELGSGKGATIVAKTRLYAIEAANFAILL